MRSNELVVRKISILLMTNMLIVSCSIYNQSYNEKHNESIKSEKVKKLLSSKKLNLTISPSFDEKKYNSCSQFYKDFKTQKNIEYVKPVVRTDDKEHPKLKIYRSCRDSDDPVHPGRYTDLYNIGDFNYQLYEIAQPDYPHFKQSIIYGEFERDARHYQKTGYSIIDFSNCSFTGKFPVQNIYVPDKVFKSENINALIRYEDEYYVFDLADIRFRRNDDSRYSLYVYSINHDNFTPACIFDEGYDL